MSLEDSVPATTRPTPQDSASICLDISKKIVSRVWVITAAIMVNNACKSAVATKTLCTYPFVETSYDYAFK